MMILSFSAYLVLLFSAVRATPTGEPVCEGYSYMYTLQPPESTVCNPYIRSILNLTCAVSGNLVEDIQWYFRPTNGGPVVILTNNSQVNITRSRFGGHYSVAMLMSGLNEENEGFYWCQGFVRHNEQSLELSQSAEFQLLSRDMYIPFACPKKSQKNSDVRCAAIIPLPLASNTLSPLYSTGMLLLLPTTEAVTVGISPTTAVSDREPTAPTPGPTTANKLSPTSGPTVMDNTIDGGSESEVPPTDPDSSDSTSSKSTTGGTTVDTPITQDSNQLSDIILYAILGLLGCLVVLVFCLSIIISILCCRKRHHHNLEGKDAPYDQFSTESEALPGSMTLKSLESFPMTPPPPPLPPYRLPLHPSHSSTMTSSSSGVYDEIHTFPPHHHHVGVYPLYQEIHADRVDSAGTASNGCVPSTNQLPADSASSASRSDGNKRREPGSGHPYDVPISQTNTRPTHVPLTEQNTTSHVTNPSTGNSHHNLHDSQPPHQHSGYDTLQRVKPLSTESTDGHESSHIVSSSEFTNCNLQVTPPPEDKGVLTEHLTGSSFPTTLELETATLPPTMELVPEIGDEEEQNGSESTAPTLPAIPENHYHVLEADQNEKTHSRGAMDLCNGPLQPRILSHVTFSEDEGYDRLVGPPHIYHILQKSPSLVRPVVRECSPVSGYHHLENRMDSDSYSSSISKEQARCLVRLPASSIDSDIPQSEESSVVSGSEIFDDPQYNASPKRQGALGSDELLKLPVQRNSHSGHVTTPERKKMDNTQQPDTENMSKYRGDYERDPMYMQKLATTSDSNSVSIGTKMTPSRSTSLPDIAHTYQSLQPLTRDPLRNYEMLHRNYPANV